MQQCPTAHPTRPDMQPERWPLHSGLPLGPLPTAAGCARAHAKVIMTEWGMAGQADAVTSVVSELITNACAAACAVPGGPHPVWLFLASDGRHVLIAVWDPCQSPPQPLDPDADAESGRGLLLVDALAKEWNWYPATWDRIDGKAVWALIADGSDGAD